MKYNKRKKGIILVFKKMELLMNIVLELKLKIFIMNRKGIKEKNNKSVLII